METKLHIICSPSELEGKFTLHGIYEGTVDYSKKTDVKKLKKSLSKDLRKPMKTSELSLKPYWRFFDSETSARSFFRS